MKLVALKRGTLFLIARIFDPLGLSSPVVFFAKHLMKLKSHGMKNYIFRSVKFSTNRCQSCGNYNMYFFDMYSTLCYYAFWYSCCVIWFLWLIWAWIPWIAWIYPLCRFIWFPFHVQNKTCPWLELCGSVLIANWMSHIRMTLSEELEVVETNAWVDTTIAFNWLVVHHMILKVLCRIGSIKYNSCCRNFSGII